MFEKFLGGAPKPEEPSKLKSGQKGYRKPKHLCKRPPRYDERHDPETGWLKPKYRKRKNAGSKHYKVRLKRRRESSAEQRRKTGFKYEKQYRATLRRKYVQSRSFSRRSAIRSGSDPDRYYQITYEQWVEVWESAEDVWRDGKFWKATQLQDSPLRKRKDCTWFDRLDRSKPFTIDNVCVMYRGKPLKRKSEPAG